MANVIKIRKGLNINLRGKAENKKDVLTLSSEYAVQPDNFIGLKPKVLVKEGDNVLAGDSLFSDKNNLDLTVASPISGIVTAVERGERRKVLSIKIKADSNQSFKNFGKKDVSALNDVDVINSLLESGLFSYINQRPYDVVANPNSRPKAIFISALRDMPLAGDFEFELLGNEVDFQTGLSALSHITKTYLGIGIKQNSRALVEAKDVEIRVFDGPCPTGNIGVQINHVSPINKGEVVWTVDPTAVIFFGRLFNSGKVDLRRTVAVAGSRISEPKYIETLVGTPLKDILNGKLTSDSDVRIIDGNPLTGRQSTINGYLGVHTSEVTAISEGEHADEILGWIRPRTQQFSVSRSYFSWLFGKKKEYDLDARIKGGERHMIMSGEYDKVLPMDIFGEYLIKAIITGDIDRQEQLGIYEVAPEDFALAEFVDSSKLELQKIVREGLDILRKENS
jgi:Na+-transporting NADH:ubiquinone oxidoreductase subunit A